MLRRQYRETAEYGSRASLTLARDDSTSTPRRRPRLREDRLQRGPIRRSNIEKLRSMDPGASLALARDDSTSTRRRRPRLREDRLQRGPIRRSNIEKLRSMDPGPRSRSPGTTAGVWQTPLSRLRPFRQRREPDAVDRSRPNSARSSSTAFQQ